jgi:hypothetical protein
MRGDEGERGGWGRGEGCIRVARVFAGSKRLLSAVGKQNLWESGVRPPGLRTSCCLPAQRPEVCARAAGFGCCALDFGCMLRLPALAQFRWLVHIRDAPPLPPPHSTPRLSLRPDEVQGVEGVAPQEDR